MKISNPSEGNVIASTDPVTIDVDDAAVAGALGTVSDGGHGHPVRTSDFWQLLGEQLTEGTTTSTSAVDISTISGLTIPVATPLLVCFSVRKSAGAGNDARVGFKVNATVVSEAVQTSEGLWITNTVDEAQDGAVMMYLAPRLATYLHGGARVAGASHGNGPDDAWRLQTAAIPDAEITALTIRGFVDDALITLGIDLFRVYGLPTT